jgi:cytidine kinase
MAEADSTLTKTQAGPDIVMVGSIGIDTIQTPNERRENVLGGSNSYACAAAALFARVGMVGVVGNDFTDEYRALYTKCGIDLTGLQTAEGKTFRWSGVYEDDMINRRTLSTELNVFGGFAPQLPELYRPAPYFLLGNISPELQLMVLDQAKRPRFVVADTMDLWISTAIEPLTQMISRVNMLMLNDSEIRLLTGEQNLLAGAQQILNMGPQYVVIKKGEHGAMLVTRSKIFLVPAFPVAQVKDPTGAGDTFAGAFLGLLASRRMVSERNVKEGLLYASVAASFAVEDFSPGRLMELTRDDVDSRLLQLKKMLSWD